MAVQQILDITKEYLTGSQSGTPFLVKIDVGGWDYAVVQFIGLEKYIYFFSTNDSGAIDGVSDGSAISSMNARPVYGILLSNGSSTLRADTDNLVRFNSICRYLWLDGSENTVDLKRILVRLYKIK